MSKNKPDPKPAVFKRQILRSANAYTDSRIDELLKLIELSEDEETTGDGDDKTPGGGGGGGGGGRGPGLGVIFPPDIPTPWIIPRPPVRDVSEIGKVTSIQFQESDDKFTYDTTKKYGSVYLSSDGGLTATVTVQVEGDGEVEDFEIQVTKID